MEAEIQSLKAQEDYQGPQGAELRLQVIQNLVINLVTRSNLVINLAEIRLQVIQKSVINLVIKQRS